MPMPQSGPRRWPLTERRKVVTPAVITAAETMLPSATVTDSPFTHRVILSGMNGLLLDSIWQVRLYRDGGRAVEQLVNQEFRRAERSRDAKPFVTGRKVDIFLLGRTTDERQIIGCSRAESR